MSRKAIPTSPPATAEIDASVAESAGWPAMPTETEIYILPDGRVVIADLPAELAPVLVELGVSDPGPLAASESRNDER